jgi:hypothetical protein
VKILYISALLFWGLPAFADPICAPTIDVGSCRKAKAVLEKQIVEITSGNASDRLMRSMENAPERPLEGTNCFYKYGKNINGIITKCIEPRQLTTIKSDVPVVLNPNKMGVSCNKTGQVTGLDPKGDNYLSVRGGSSGNHREVDRLGKDDPVWICAEQGEWYAIIFPRKVDFSACDVNKNSSTPYKYRGPCETGWVHRSYVRVTAG